MKDNLLDELAAVATQAALEAGKLVRTKFAEPRQVSEKGFRDLVTDADTAAQQLIVDLIRSHFPDHGFLVEEEAANLPASGPIIWVIDPVDGTTNYSRQVPVYSISIAAVKPPPPPSTLAEPQILVGVIYDPTREERFHAAAGQGAFLNERRIKVSTTDTLERAILAVDWSHAPQKRQITLNMLQHVAHQVQTLRAIGSAALALAWVAAGRLDAYFNLNLKPWDIAAGKLLIEEAGGRLTSMNDQPWHFEDVGCAAANGRIFDAFKMRLQEVNNTIPSQPS